MATKEKAVPTTDKTISADKTDKETKSKDLVKKGATDLATFTDFAQDAGAGMANADKDSFAIPFLAVLQSNSPQCEETAAKYIEGAKKGQFFNSVSSRLIDGSTGALFLPCDFQRRFIKWGPRGGKNAGFKGEFLTEEAAKLRNDGAVIEQDGKLYYPLADGTLGSDPKEECDRLVDTRNHFGLLINEEDGSYSKIVLSLSSTQIKKSKALMTMLGEVKVETPSGKVNPPTWFNKVRFTTVPEKNDKGSWHGIKPALEGNLSDYPNGAELYAEAKAFYKAIAAGTAGPVQYAEPEETGGDEAGENF